MNRYTALAAAAIGLAVAGCQHSGHAETKPDESRPQMAAEKTPDASVYNTPYVTTTDTPWLNTSIDQTAGGTLKTGETVWLRSDASMSGIIPAKTADGRIIYVRAADLRAK